VFLYKVEANRDVIVEGLATFKADEVRTFSAYDEQQFFNMRGLHLNQCNVPSGVTVTIQAVEEA